MLFIFYSTESDKKVNFCQFLSQYDVGVNGFIGEGKQYKYQQITTL